ncbi:ABC transporter substrate-binding protein [Paenibacillus sacheonensis]|uniref:Extracellular solute-binding protein n=1 Tax=Paenibacillus sacheonensis TaxID=742054 RepID=A0A7X4YR51_9BACL|nr:ABC transporter substrate-binding protein [Paenibacillus sacheonensis]MBM7563659.1 putative aldouronate transport system substrate-binding protein [Paenibacillus sacheonensis]NBC71047.1 extracellular solute-binding protein [Paenibacillus sacheonensis]
MQRKSKIATALLTVAFVSSLALTGCGNSNNGNNGNAANAAELETGNANANAAQTENEAPADDKPALDPVELSIYYPGTEQKDVAAVEEEMNKLLKDKINATVKINAVDWGNWSQKINLMVASGEPFDLLFTAGWDNFSGNVAKGAFLDVTSLIDQYAPETKAQMNPELLTGTAIDGKNYAVPVEKEMASEFGIVLNKDLADKYSFDIGTIKSYADLEPMLQTIKEKEPNVVPFWGGKNNISLIPFEQIGAVPGAIKKDGATTVVDQWETPEMKDMLKLMKDWNQKGYFQKDPATQKDAGPFNKAGTVFAQWQQLTPGKDKVLSQQWGHPIVQVVMTEPYTTSGDLNGAMTAISRTSKNPERAMMLINLLHTDAQLLNTLVNGVEGKHFAKASNTVIKLPDGVVAGQSGYAPGNNYMFGSQFLNYLWDNEDPKKWEAYKAFNASAKPSPIVGFSYNAEPVKNEEAAIANIYNTYIDGLSTGVMDPDKDLPAFIDKMKKAGLDKVIAEKQKQIDAFLSSKK